MADFETRLLSTKDGSWDTFREDWVAQCDQVGDLFEDYGPDALSVIAGIATGGLTSVGGFNNTRVGALWDTESERFYACFMLNQTKLPGHDGVILRVRHLLVSPLLDHGVASVQMYPDVVVGVMAGIIHLSSTVLEADSIHFHLRSPEDMSYFRAFGMALDGTKVFESVQIRGSWLYIKKAGAAANASEEVQIG